LDLRFNPELEVLEIAPFEIDHAIAPEPERGPRAIPPPLPTGKRKERRK
jgi:hypothetical protein